MVSERSSERRKSNLPTLHEVSLPGTTGKVSTAHILSGSDTIGGDSCVASVNSSENIILSMANNDFVNALRDAVVNSVSIAPMIASLSEDASSATANAAPTAEMMLSVPREKGQDLAAFCGNSESKLQDDVQSDGSNCEHDAAVGSGDDITDEQHFSMPITFCRRTSKSSLPRAMPSDFASLSIDVVSLFPYELTRQDYVSRVLSVVSSATTPPIFRVISSLGIFTGTMIDSFGGWQHKRDASLVLSVVLHKNQFDSQRNADVDHALQNSLGEMVALLCYNINIYI